MVNRVQICPELETLRRLMEGELSDAQSSEVEVHLSGCERCRERMEHQFQSSDWWQQARSSLRNPSDEWELEDERFSQNADVLARLGPTDDPQKLGRIAGYEIVGILGRGGMGVVFKGFDAPLNRYVAIKMLLPHLAASGAARKRFGREAQAAAAIVDDHVMAIHNVSAWNGLPYLVMPYSKGVSLQTRLAENGPLELAEILRIGHQAAKGLAAAHAQGLVHRDVKPANILLDEGVERVTLTDFGLARAVDDASLTRTGMLAGTPQYMSPEQAQAQPIDARSDLFSLGSVLYALCTGRPPFRAESSYAVLQLIADKDPPPIQEYNPDIPEWFCKMVGRLMSKRVEDRFATAAEVAELFEACIAHVHSPNRNSLPSVPLRWSFLTRLIPIMSDKRILSLVALGLLLATVLFPWPIAAIGRDEPALIFAGVSAFLALFFALLSRSEYFSRIVLWTFGGVLGLGVLGLCLSVPIWVWRSQEITGIARSQERLAIERVRAAAILADHAAKETRPIDRSNARTVVETYVAAALAGDAIQAFFLAQNAASDPSQIADLSEQLNVRRLAMNSVYISDPLKPTSACAVSVPVQTIDPQPDGQREGVLVFTLAMHDEVWSVIDIDFESVEGADRELKRFLEANPASVESR